MNPARRPLSVLIDAGRHPVSAFVHSLVLATAVAAVVLTLAVGAGAHRAARSPVQGLGPDVALVSAVAPSSSGVQSGLPSSSITTDDVEALGARGFVPDGVKAVPTAGLRTDLRSVARSWNTDVIGSSQDFATVRDYTVARGRFFTSVDIQTAAPLLVVGQTVVNHLFAGSEPVGQQVTIDKHSFQVVGVLNPRGFSGGFDQDDLAVMPITAAWSGLLQNKTVIDQVLVKAASVAQTGKVKSEAINTLLRRHQVANPAAADFEVHTLRDLTARQQQGATAVKHAMAVAAVALLAAAAIHHHALLTSAPGRWAPTVPAGRHRRADARTPADALTRAAIATVLGLVLAAVSTRPFAHVTGGIPAPEVTLPALAWGAAIGMFVGGGLVWFPSAVTSIRARSQQSPGGSGTISEKKAPEHRDA